MTSVERVIEYTKLEPEQPSPGHDKDSKKTPNVDQGDQTWPINGEIKVQYWSCIYIVYNVRYIVYNIHNTVYHIHCMMYNIQHTLYTVYQS